MDFGCSSMIVMRRLVRERYTKKDSVMQWTTQAINIATNIKFEVKFTLPELSATKVVAWKFRMDDSAKGRYAITLERDLLTEL